MSAIRMPSTTVAWVLPTSRELQRRCAFTALDVRLPYDRQKARLISIRGSSQRGKAANESQELLKVDRRKFSDLFSRDRTGRGTRASSRRLGRILSKS